MDIVLGLGDVGRPLLNLISQTGPASGYDKKNELSVNLHIQQPVEIMHVCYPYSEDFIKETRRYSDKYRPKVVVIHSTVKPHTTEKMQNMITTPIIFSPVRGVHARMVEDLKRYRKYYALYPHPEAAFATKVFEKRFHKIGIETKRVSSPLSLEYSKILVDTSYYGWLIIYAQITNEICVREALDYDELWDFSEEIHKFLGNRPKMYPGVIGGHCVIPNIRILNDQKLNLIKEQNTRYYRLHKRRESASVKNVGQHAHET